MASLLLPIRRETLKAITIMESNITEQEYFASDSLTEPHFDEDATIAAARPVVPLEEIKAQPNRRRLAFGLSLLASIIIGALGGTFIYKQRHSKPAAEIVDLAIAGSGAQATSQEISEQPTTEALAQEEPTSGATAGEAETSQPIISNRKPARTIAQREPTSGADSISQEESISREDRKEARRLARIENRRERRTARQDEREAWGRRRSSDDLLRIREIFEGPRRP